MGIAVGEGIGAVPGAAPEVVPAGVPGVGEGARIPDGIPGAAGRTPFGLASVEPALSGAGPAVEGRLIAPPCCWVAAPLWFALPAGSPVTL